MINQIDTTASAKMLYVLFNASTERSVENTRSHLHSHGGKKFCSQIVRSVVISFFCETSATGKRHRRQFNPNSWTASIPTNRHNILCLGMSYPCTKSTLQEFDLGKKVLIEHPNESVEQAVELVRRNILTQMDGRDLARVLALEANNDMLAYTVSMEKGAEYMKRHLDANFNKTNFANTMKVKWGTNVKFRQVSVLLFSL